MQASTANAFDTIAPMVVSVVGAASYAAGVVVVVDEEGEE